MQTQETGILGDNVQEQESRDASPDVSGVTSGMQGGTDTVDPYILFSVAVDPYRTPEDTLQALPPRDEANYLLDCYFRLLAWDGTPVTRPDLELVFTHTYEHSSVDAFTPYEFQRVGLVYVCLALGTLVNMELPAHDPSGTKYFIEAQRCLLAGKYMTNNTLTCLSALVSDFLVTTGGHD